MDLWGRCRSCFEEIGDLGECPFCGYYEGQEPKSPAFLKPGLILENKYLIGGALGQGGFGITYLSWDINLNIKLAIKEYFPQDLATRAQGNTEISAYSGSLGGDYEYGLEKFLQEARTLARFENHPNVVSIRDFFKANGTAYFVMYYVEGITLKDYLKQSGGITPFTEAKKLIIPVLDALKEVHMADILHRDISPDNIFINKKGQVILLDFGAARQALGGKGKNLSIILKPGYAPEEQYRSKGIQGPWTDIYAVAATFYHLITGNMPPESLERMSDDQLVPPSKVGVELTEQEETALMKALAVNASDRYQTADEFLDAIMGDAEVGGSTVLEAPVSIDEGGSQKTTDDSVINKIMHNPLYLGIVVALVIGIALMAYVFSGLFNTGNQEKLTAGTTQIIVNGETLILSEGEISYQEGTYSGQHLNGIPYGSGIWTHPEGLFYEGEWKDGQAEGFGIMTWANGDRYEGEWKEDMFNGQGTFNLADGEVYKGEWLNDMRHGQGTINYPDGAVYSGEWKGNLYYGRGTLTWGDGRKYIGEFKDNMRDGKGTMYWPDGMKYEGQWNKDLMDGFGLLVLPGGETYEGEFANDKMHGQGIFTFSDGSEIVGLWQEGDFISGN